MALGGPIAAVQLAPAAAGYALWVGGLDVIREPATTKRYGVTIESVELEVQGPGGVSSLDFTIDDPSKLITVSDGQEVRLHDLALDTPLFTGFVEHWEYVAAFGNQGRTIAVSAVGSEILMDWLKTGSALSWSTVVPLKEIIGAIVGVLIAPGPLRAFASATLAGTQAQPIGECGTPTNDNLGVVVPLTIAAGTTLREAIRLAAAACPYASGVPFPGVRATVDATYGLRVWPAAAAIGGSILGPDGDPSIIVGGGAATKGEVHYAIDAAAIVRAVLVMGSGVSVVVGDGSGKLGRTEVLTDTSLTTLGQCQVAGAAYLEDFRSSTRAAVKVDETVTDYMDVLAKLNLTDAETGATATYEIASIGFTFWGAKRDVTFALGGHAPAASRLVRSLTRSTLS